jgi:hypothetical protein
VFFFLINFHPEELELAGMQACPLLPHICGAIKDNLQRFAVSMPHRRCGQGHSPASRAAKDVTRHPVDGARVCWDVDLFVCMHWPYRNN